MIEVEDYHQRLLQEREDLRQQAESTSADRRPVELDQQSVGRLSRMDAMQVQAMAKASEQRRQNRLRKIDAALKRIEEDEFGYCVACGEEIAPKRLELDPTVPRCIDCAEA
ncbi:TraR/DksA family transcriptional regulator [Fodinicurvata fenggangensis]|uniref:TraR/DksA family transcriptional regulator n=1 Tax=Fodinicurvata fenggangensis TaxID=1121830 RepID=UPI000478D861|nr:TraR/DksA C4-type zinc finger protein [Fodinicurvata fenggangensis]